MTNNSSTSVAETPLLVSRLNKSGIRQSTRIALILVSNLGSMLLIGKWNVLLVSFPATMFILVSYLRFTYKTRFFEWRFYEDRVEILSGWPQRTRSISWDRVTTWDERRRSGTQSRFEYIPDYTEFAFWIEHQQGFTFDELDYANYQDMARFVAERLSRKGLEEAR